MFVKNNLNKKISLYLSAEHYHYFYVRRKVKFEFVLCKTKNILSVKDNWKGSSSLIFRGWWLILVIIIDIKRISFNIDKTSISYEYNLSPTQCLGSGSVISARFWLTGSDSGSAKIGGSTESKGQNINQKLQQKTKV